MLLLTDDGPEKSGLQELVIGGIKEEFQKFRREFNKTSLKLLVLNFGKDKAFFDQLADATVRNNRKKLLHSQKETNPRVITDHQTVKQVGRDRQTEIMTERQTRR